MVNCPFCDNAMAERGSSVISHVVRESKSILVVRYTWTCKLCNATLERMVSTEQTILKHEELRRDK